MSGMPGDATTYGVFSKLVRVETEDFRVLVSLGCPSITEDHEKGVICFGIGVEELPEGRRVEDIVLGRSFLGMNKRWKLSTVANGEDGFTEKHPVQVTFIGVQLEGESTCITYGIGRSSATGHGREADTKIGLLSYSAEEVCAGEGGYIICDFKDTSSTGTLGVYQPLWDALVSSMRDNLKEIDVTKEQCPWKLIANPQGCLWILDWQSTQSGIISFLLVLAVR